MLYKSRTRQLGNKLPKIADFKKTFKILRFTMIIDVRVITKHDL